MRVMEILSTGNEDIKHRLFEGIRFQKLQSKVRLTHRVTLFVLNPAMMTSTDHSETKQKLNSRGFICNLERKMEIRFGDWSFAWLPIVR